MELELGSVRKGPIAYAWGMLKTIWRTWRFARANGLPCNEWFGAYEKGTENVIAHFGPLPSAEANASRFVAAAKARAALEGR